MHALGVGGFAFLQCGNSAGLGLKTQESHGDRIDRLRQSRRVDGGLRYVASVRLARFTYSRPAQNCYFIIIMAVYYAMKS